MKLAIPVALMASAGLVGAVSESKCAVCSVLNASIAVLFDLGPS